jgi:tRNA(fMet)-specific endonuclease VapC
MYLLDSDTVIFSLKGVPKVLENLRTHDADPKAISVITYGELLFGAAKSARPGENAARVRRIAEILPVVEVSRAVMETFGSLKAALERKGRIVGDLDLVIAATALVLSYKVVTNNERHFQQIPGLQVVNWSKD